MKQTKTVTSRWQANWLDPEAHADFVNEVASHLAAGQLKYLSAHWPKIRPYVSADPQEQARLSVVLGRDIMSVLSARNVKLHVQCYVDPKVGDEGHLLRVVAVEFPVEATGQIART